MNIDKYSGWLDIAECQSSPNCDERPDPDDISGIVIHNISLPPQEFGGPFIKQLFLNQLDADAHPYFAEIAHLRVSAHLLVQRDGALIQFVPFQQRAWHAGESQWLGRERCNDFTIGIELEGDDFSAFDDRQYVTLAEAIKTLIATYPKLTAQTITGHQHIAPGRKTDPGPFFDWQRLQKLLT